MVFICPGLSVVQIVSINSEGEAWKPDALSGANTKTRSYQNLWLPLLLVAEWICGWCYFPSMTTKVARDNGKWQTPSKALLQLDIRCKTQKYIIRLRHAITTAKPVTAEHQITRATPKPSLRSPLLSLELIIAPGLFLGSQQTRLKIPSIILSSLPVSATPSTWLLLSLSLRVDYIANRVPRKMFWLLCIPVIMGALTLGATTTSFQKCKKNSTKNKNYHRTMLSIRFIIKYLIRVIIWLLGQILRLKQREKLDKVGIFIVSIIESCMQALDNTFRTLLSVWASTGRLEIHPVLLITLVLLPNLLSFRAGRNFEEDKQGGRKMQFQTDIAEKDARIEKLEKQLKEKEETVASLKKKDVSPMLTRQKPRFQHPLLNPMSRKKMKRLRNRRQSFIQRKCTSQSRCWRTVLLFQLVMISQLQNPIHNPTSLRIFPRWRPAKRAWPLVSEKRVSMHLKGGTRKTTKEMLLPSGPA